MGCMLSQNNSAFMLYTLVYVDNTSCICMCCVLYDNVVIRYSEDDFMITDISLFTCISRQFVFMCVCLLVCVCVLFCMHRALDQGNTGVRQL